MSGKPGTRRSKRKKSNRPKRENDFRESLPADLRQQLRERYEERYKPGEGRALIERFQIDWGDRVKANPDPPGDDTVRNFFDKEAQTTFKYWVIDGFCQLLLDCSLDDWKRQHQPIQDVQINPVIECQSSKEFTGRELALMNPLQRSSTPPSKLNSIEWTTPSSFITNPIISANNGFVGRENIIQQLESAANQTLMIVILGIPYIGKTALMQQIASRLAQNKKCVFWYDFRAGLISLGDVLIQLARFLDNQPQREDYLVSALQSPILSENEQVALIVEELNKGCYHLFFDSVHHIDKESALGSFFSVLKQQLQQGTIFIASRSKPCFCKPIDEANKIIRIFEVDGLREFEELQDFFARRGISLSPKLAHVIDFRFGGLPLALELIAALLSENFTEEELLWKIDQAEEQTIESLFEEVYEQLDSVERELLITASLFSFSFPLEYLLGGFRAIFEHSNGKFYFTRLKQKLLITQSELNLYKVHEVICTLTLNYVDEPETYLVQLADYLVSQTSDDPWIQLEAMLLYYRAGAFEQSAELLVSLVGMGMLPYYPDIAKTMLDEFQEEMVSSEQWIWLLGCKGQLAHFWRRCQEAEDYYRKMLRLAGEIQDKSAAAVAFQRLGIIYYDKNFEIAEKNYLSSFAIYKETHDLEGQSQIYNQLGLLYTNQGKLAEAEFIFQKGLDILDNLEAPDWKRLWLYGNLGPLYAEQGNWEEAIRLTEKVCRIAIEMDMPEHLARATYNLGLYAVQQGHHKVGYKHYLEALEIAQKSKLVEVEELVQFALGQQYYTLGKYDKAVTCFERVIEILEKFNDKSKLATTYFNIGSLYAQDDNYKVAIDYYKKALGLFEYLYDKKQIDTFIDNVYVIAQKSVAYRPIVQSLKMLKKQLLLKSPSYTLAKVYGILGEIYWKLLQKNRVALACMRQEITLLAKLNCIESQVEALSNLSIFYEEVGCYGKALDTNTEIIQIAEMHSLERCSSVTYYNRGNCFVAFEMWQQADDDYRQALAIAENIGDTQLQDLVYHNLGEMYRRWGRLEKAVELLSLSLESSRKRSDIDAEITTLNNMGLAYWELCRPSEAVTCFNKALDISRQRYRKNDESKILISLGNFYLVDEQPEQAKHYYEKALTAARVAEDIDLEEDSILSLAYAHRELGTIENITDDFKAIAERADKLKHYGKLIQFLVFCGDINGEEGKLEDSSEMLAQALLIAYIILLQRCDSYGSRTHPSVLGSEMRQVVNKICDIIKDLIEQGAIQNAKDLYNMILDKVRQEGESFSWIIEHCLMPIGRHLEKLATSLQ